MPIHDWTRVEPGLFHAFHQSWITHLSEALNSGVLPADHFALPEQRSGGTIPDVLTLRLSHGLTREEDVGGGVAVAARPPKARLIQQGALEAYARKADRISIRHRRGNVVAIIEIVSPGNKQSRAEMRSFVEKSVRFLQEGIHLVVVDLFPPTKRDPQGIHRLIWDEIEDAEFDLPVDKPLTIAAYESANVVTAFVENAAVGDLLPEAPLFLRAGVYVPAPLEVSYQTTWKNFPSAIKELLEAI